MTKYIINYDIKIITYNVYYRAMLGLDKNFLPQKISQRNVRNVLNNNYDIVAIQESICLDKIFPNKSKYQLVKGKSNKESIVTMFSNKFKVINNTTFEFSSGRPIMITLIKHITSNKKWIIVNLHAPHNYNNFGNYNGRNVIDQTKYNNQILKILRNKIRKFIKSNSNTSIDTNIDRIIIMGDFNELFLKSDINSFNIILNGKKYIMKTDSNKPISCCFPSISKFGDLIFDSKIEPNLYIPVTREPASDHLPVVLNTTS